ncbi:MAG TPA: efflux RND transporter permease subunit [Planctomycetota bacterium]|nr:efflux RND transporter permease subunit [Planctomycetota bacterium]
MSFVARAYSGRRALFVLLALLLMTGVTAVFTSARSIYPCVAFPRIAVIAERGEQPVRGMLVAVTRPIEQAVSTVPDLLRVRSRTLRGACELSLDFRDSADMRDALSLVRARTASAGLPPDVQLTIEQQTPAVFPVLSFNVIPGKAAAGDPVARARLAEWAELDLKPRLARLPDTFMVSVQSGDQREYVYEPDPVALAQAGVTLDAVEQAIAAANAVAAVGRSETEGLQYQLLVDGQLSEPEQILELAVPRGDGSVVRLRELGQLVETTAERTMVVTGGGRDGVVVSVFLRDGGRVTDLSRDVAGILDEVRPLVPGGGTLVPVYDQASLANDSIEGVGDAIAVGAALSILVIALFLGSWRVTLVTGLAIPLSVLLTLATFPLVGESLNLMSLGGLAVAIGLIIDDAIVVVENVARRAQALAPGASRRELFEAVAGGTREVLGAIVGSSLTTVVVFLPLVLLQGVVGQFFRSLSLALGLSILASMVVSLVYTPLMLLAPRLAPSRGLRPRAWMVRLQEAYVRQASRALAHPGLTALLLLVCALLGAAGLRGLQTGFLPEMDEGGFVLDYALPVGSSLSETDAACRRIEAILLATPEVSSLSRRTGAELGFFATEQFTGDMLVGLVPRADRERSVFEVLDELRERLAREVPQADVEFMQVMQDTIGDLSGNEAVVEVKLLGADYPDLQRAADDVEQALQAVPGVVDIKNHVSFGSPELTWRPDPLASARVGLSTGEIADQVRAQLLGEVVTRLRQGDRFLDVRVRYPDRWRVDRSVEGEGPPLLLSVPSAGAGSSLVPLSSLASFTRTLAENELERENQTPMVRVTAAIAGRDLGSASRAVERAVHALPRDPGVRVEFGGQAQSQGQAFRNLLLVFGLGGGLVFLLLVVQFRSLRLPTVMFLALPFGQLGGLLALRLADVPLNISSGMGLIMLVGLVVKNGIILIEYAQQLRRDGLAERDAILAAARVRLRPILMTTCAAIAGLLPLALAVGAGSQLQQPLAVAVIGGLLVSTAFTLVVVPLGCDVLARGHLLPEEADAR